MSDSHQIRDETRADRIARYKENRRQQLNTQIQNRLAGESALRKGAPTATSSGSSIDSRIATSHAASPSDGPRTTRTSRLRAAVSGTTENVGTIRTHGTAVGSSNEKTSNSPQPSRNTRRGDDDCSVGKDKSSKRKSNLNRALDSEEVPSVDDIGEDKNVRRRRKVIPKAGLEAQGKKGDVNTSTANSTAPSNDILGNFDAHNITTSVIKSTPKKSQLAIHMENARKGISATNIDAGRTKSSRSSSLISVDKPHKLLNGLSKLDSDHTKFNKENIKQSSLEKHRTSKEHSDNQHKTNINRLNNISNLTKETLARIERLTKRTKNSPVREVPKKVNISTSDSKITRKSSRASSVEKVGPSILKKKSLEDAEVPIPQIASSSPISILKRKISQDDHKAEASNTPPVTFSPSVKEPSSTKRKQGILKKRRSLDESLVLRRRSCSPEIASKSDSKPILKGHRRSSLEDLTIHSPEIHGILKRRTSKNEEEADQSFQSPQSILKRRSGASSAGSTVNTPHVSITTAVILAAASGAEMVLDSENIPVRPILKKKSISDEQTYSDNSHSDVPRPILKKKHSTDTDDNDERPRPILKFPRGSTDRETENHVKISNQNDAETEMKPILKQTRDESPRSRLSFSGEGSAISQEVIRRHQRSSRRSHTICADYLSLISDVVCDGTSNLQRERPLSVSELVTNFERTTSPVYTGAIPKRGLNARNSERYKTQPITSDEYEASLLYVASPQNEHGLNHYLLSQSALQNEAFSSSLRESNSDCESCPKVSSDSAFQSLLDGLEIDDNDNKLAEMPFKNAKSRAGFDQLMETVTGEGNSMKTNKAEAYNLQTNSSGSDFEKGKNSRRTTQPVTFEEVQEASKLQPDDPSNLSLSERIRLFNKNILIEEKLKKRSAYALDVSKPTSRKTSQITIPDITYDEGISCNDSGSDSENASALVVNANKMDKRSSSGLSRSLSARLSKYSNRCNDSTSESESSGGREVKNILGTDRSNIKKALEGLLSKSKGNEHNVTVRRSHTIGGKRTPKEGEMPQSIAELQATLQRKGESGWRKRHGQNNAIDDELKLLKEKNKYNVELSEKTILASKKDELDAASKQWKCRVEKSDADKFSVSGRMDKAKESIPVNIPTVDVEKRIPQAKRFKGKSIDSSSTPTSPEKNSHLNLKRSQSNPDPGYQTSNFNVPTKLTTKNVPVVRPDDFTFKNFFKSVETKTDDDAKQRVEFNLEDFDVIERHSLLVQKKNVQVQKRRVATRNPIRALAERDDIKNEYTEVLTGVAERESRRMNIEKLAKNCSNFAVEALAGLASKEDFKAIPLKKGTGPSTLLPYKDLMLIQVKGRRHVQLRIVEPVAISINEGDCYLLVTRKALYNFIGAYSNVIEQARAADVASHIQKTNDLGCKVSKVITIDSKMSPETSREARSFWELLGNSTSGISNAGNPSEDEIYESNISLTNMIYELDQNELVPVEEYWGNTPKYEMLTSTSVYVFDFGSEMYVWSGKNAASTEKQKVLKLAKELWNEGYNYAECAVCPLNIAQMLGERTPENLSKLSDARPEWALFAKVTQHGETILFKEKFLNWPDFSRVIRIKRNSDETNVDPSYDIQPIDVNEILKTDSSQPDITVEGNHLGRGDAYYDEETKRLFQFDTADLNVWRIMENTFEVVKEESIGQFYDADSYIVRWKFRITVKGRELSGKPSKYGQVGRDSTVFFYWQGCNSSINEKGVAALLTVELDSESAPQIRVTQGNEPAAFLRLFNGMMVVHKGKINLANREQKKSQLYIVRGEMEKETYLLEVPCSAHQLRSRSSLLLVNPKQNDVTIWHGSKSTQQTRKVIKKSVENLLKERVSDMNLNGAPRLNELEEGKEDQDFNKTLGNTENSYVSLLNEKRCYEFTPRFFTFSSISGAFSATEVYCPHRSEHSSPFPILQEQLYCASQPALFLIDNNYELWLWQGWWPDTDEGGVSIGDQTGSGAIRWQSERKAAMKTAINYWKKKHGDDSEVKANLVWAGLEPPEFQTLFPFWSEKKDVAELNMKEGKTLLEKRNLEKELALLSRTEFPLSELMERPLPEGVDPTHIEDYLSPNDFMQVLSMTKEEFQKLPIWKQTALKKEKGLF